MRVINQITINLAGSFEARVLACLFNLMTSFLETCTFDRASCCHTVIGIYAVCRVVAPSGDCVPLRRCKFVSPSEHRSVSSRRLLLGNL